MLIGVVSLGCAKNRVDTEQMLSVLSRAGYSITNDFSLADILIVNTCGFINPAKEESIETILELAKYKEKGQCRLLCVTGCLSQRYGTELMNNMPEIDLLVGINQYDNLPELIAEALNGKRIQNTKRRRQSECMGRVLTTKPYNAYVRIGEGCDNRCAYCAIPLIRGGHVSRKMSDVLDEMRILAQNGAREQILIAQDTTRFGQECEGVSLRVLMKNAASIPGIDWLRVLYCYPDETNFSLIDEMAAHPNICRYLDLPLQHASPSLLKRMNRRGDIEKIKDLLLYAKEKGFVLRTTFIVGFPGETEHDFNLLMDFTKEMAFDRMGAFTFSKEEDTPAYQFPQQIPEHIKKQRLHQLMMLQRDISLTNNLKRVGTLEKLLIVSQKGSDYLARSRAEAPDADGLIYLKSDIQLAEGSFVTAKITGATDYDLTAVFTERNANESSE